MTVYYETFRQSDAEGDKTLFPFGKPKNANIFGGRVDAPPTAMCLLTKADNRNWIYAIFSAGHVLYCRYTFGNGEKHENRRCND